MSDLQCPRVSSQERCLLENPYCINTNIFLEGSAYVLKVDKYAPDKSPKWKRVNERFPALYKDLLDKPYGATHGARMRQAVSASG